MNMQLTNKTSLDNQKFYKILLTIAVPIIVQNFLSSSLNMVDNLMIGNLGEESIAAVGQANQLFFLFSLMSFGLNSGGSIFFSQFHGSQDYKTFKKYMGITMLLGSLIAILFTFIAVVIPERVMSLYSDDPLVLQESVNYLRIVGLSYVISNLSMTFIFSLRATSQAFVPMLSSIIGLGTNTVLNYCLINGAFGFPRLEVRGAAIATLIARVIEFSILFYIVFIKKNILNATFKEISSFRKPNISKYLLVAAPVILNETFWSLGIMVYNFSYSKLGVSSFAAIQIQNTITQLFYVFSFGICNAAAIITGNLIGRGETETLKVYARKIIKLTFLIGVGTALLLVLAKTPILSLYKLEESTRITTSKLLTLIAFIVPIRFINVLFVVGLFRGGGDTRYSLFAETTSLWLVGVPMVSLAALYFRLPVEYVLLISFAEELVKLMICYPRYRSHKWIRSIV
ncbi:MATE family efflux transporter [Proteiniclasticum sp.]|uniref:MATE family efflux transporter n=1 Tax=Proteiniclasticum sp. TaxID=2053595 RepID=UPI00289FDBA1|nr:MATE family efflux transporter [Proteiniclasticum sp.]